MLGAYWPERDDALRNCAEATRAFLSGLPQIDRRLSQWFRLGWTKKEGLARSVNPADLIGLETLLLSGQKVRDTDRDIIRELGFSLSCWNGAPSKSDAASLRIQCGSTVSGVSNCVLLELPRD